MDEVRVEGEFVEVVEPKVWFETRRFTVTVGSFGEEKEPQYLVTNKETSVVEFINSGIYFVRDWCMQMEEALDKQDDEIKTPIIDKTNVVTFPGGGNGRSN